MDRTVTVQLGQRSYDVRVGAGVLGELGGLTRSLPAVSSAVVIADSNVAGLYGPRAVKLLREADLTARLLTFPAGEPSKTLATYGRILDELLSAEPPIDRQTVIVALGGGVTGDLAGFVAASALRGLRWIQCATTLLAAVDASVGGKTGVNHATGKNLIGAFHQPAGVLIDVDLLKTLPPGELRNGLAECVKHGVIRDEGLLTFIEDSAADIAATDADVITELIARNVAIKAAVVSADERESGQRAHLNFGHTIGHALEVLVGYDSLPHGRAVSLGMVAACRMAVTRKFISQPDADRVAALLAALHLPVSCAPVDADEVWTIMQHDKKTASGKVRMVLPTRLGAVDIFDDIAADAVADALAAIAT